MSDWDDEKWLPTIPGQRQAPPPPKPAEERVRCADCSDDFPPAEVSERDDEPLCGDCAALYDAAADRHVTRLLAHAA